MIYSRVLDKEIRPSQKLKNHAHFILICQVSGHDPKIHYMCFQNRRTYIFLTLMYKARITLEECIVKHSILIFSRRRNEISFETSSHWHSFAWFRYPCYNIRKMKVDLLYFIDINILILSWNSVLIKLIHFLGVTVKCKLLVTDYNFILLTQ